MQFGRNPKLHKDLALFLDDVKTMKADFPTTLRQVPVLAVIHEWPRVADLVRSALERGEGSYCEADVAMACMGGMWQLWIVEYDGEVVSIAITELINFPRQRKCLIRYIAGELDLVKIHTHEIEAFARREGCKVLEGYARKGWTRAMPDWTEKYVVMQKEL